MLKSLVLATSAVVLGFAGFVALPAYLFFSVVWLHAPLPRVALFALLCVPLALGAWALAAWAWRAIEHVPARPSEGAGAS